MKNQKIDAEKNQNTKLLNKEESAVKQNKVIDYISIDEQLNLLAEIIIDQLIREQNEKMRSRKSKQSLKKSWSPNFVKKITG